jgi:RNA polymerase sigma-70 factor (ECF subfamily)
VSSIVPADLDALVTRHYSGVVSYLTRQSGDSDLARDLTQDTFLSALLHIDQLTSEANFGPWLYQIARNKLRSYWRSPRPRANGLVPDDRERHTTAQRSVDSIIERDVIQQVHHCLSPAAREVLLLRHLAGYSAQEIGTLLDISSTAAQRRINRATHQFRAHYQELNTCA